MTTPTRDRLRIALLTYSTRPRGGVVHTLALAEALAGLGQQVDVWSLARGGDRGFFRPVDRSVRVQLVPFLDRENEPVGARIIRSIERLGDAFAAARDGYDIVHAEDCISANAAPGCIRTIHHLDTFATPELVACHDRAITDPIARICVSAAVADEVDHEWGLRPTVIPNGVDADRFAAAAIQQAAHRSPRHSRLGTYVLNVGGIEPRKGSADLIEAMAIVQETRPHLRLVVAGGETLFDYRAYRREVLDRADDLGIGLELLGPVDHDELPSVVAGAAVFAFPSVKEGFGIAALEAMAAGVPVVMRDLPVLREVFGDTARFGRDPAELAALILDAASDRGPSRERRRVAGESLAARYTWVAAARAHLAFYAEVLARSAAPDLAV